MKTRYIKEVITLTPCQGCNAVGKIYGHVCYLCSGQGRLPVKIHSDVTDEVTSLLSKSAMIQQFSNRLNLSARDRKKLRYLESKLLTD